MFFQFVVIAQLLDDATVETSKSATAEVDRELVGLLVVDGGTDTLFRGHVDCLFSLPGNNYWIG